MKTSRSELEQVKAQLESLLQWVESKLKEEATEVPPAQPVPPKDNPQPTATTPPSSQPTTIRIDHEPIKGMAIHERGGCIAAAIIFSALVIFTLFFLPSCIY